MKFNLFAKSVDFSFLQRFYPDSVGCFVYGMRDDLHSYRGTCVQSRVGNYICHQFLFYKEVNIMSSYFLLEKHFRVN